MDEGSGHNLHGGSEEIIELVKDQQEHEPEFDYRDYRIEDYFALGVFWLLAGIVFLQFFTRYFLNFSWAWTEEGARYLLVCVAFLGSIMAVRRNTHIFVEFFYRYLPRKTGRTLITVVDAIRIAFMVVGFKLSVTIIPKTMNNFMMSIRVPLSVLYSVILIGFAFMLFHAIKLAVVHWKDGYVPMCREEKI